jgi:hypothetical protein
MGVVLSRWGRRAQKRAPDHGLARVIKQTMRRVKPDEAALSKPDQWFAVHFGIARKRCGGVSWPLP